jgi:hypothetical protein
LETSWLPKRRPPSASRRPDVGAEFIPLGDLPAEARGNVSAKQAVDSLMDRKAHNQPADVEAVEGDVLVDGPGGLSYAFTPEAAEETSDRLLFGAGKAKGQQIQKELRRPRR